jgi:hypothetical protein
MVKVDHRPYLLSIAKIGHSRTCLQKHFEHELEFLKVFLDTTNINSNLCDLYSFFIDYSSSELQFLEYNHVVNDMFMLIPRILNFVKWEPFSISCYEYLIKLNLCLLLFKEPTNLKHFVLSNYHSWTSKKKNSWRFPIWACITPNLRLIPKFQGHHIIFPSLQNC